jgi:AcrR family transcriptional regulator
MIEVTERLVAEQGLSALTLRAVQALAQQRNKSAAQYHFGSRAGLIEAVVRARMAPVNERRAELLDRLEGPDDPAALVDVLVRPLAEATLTGTSYWARFLVQCGTDPTLAQVVATASEGQAYRECVRRLRDSLAPLAERLRARRVDHAIALAVTSLAAAEPHTGVARSLPVEAEIDDLVAMCTAVATTPATTEVLACTP